MGRGIVESGLFRSERYGLEQRTSDPASTSEGEMWIRTDLAPDTDQLATLRFDAGASTWDVPIYDVAATTENVEKVLRVPIGGTTGFIPITDALPTFSALKFQHNGAAFGAHDALTASGIPDSGDLQAYYDWSDDSVTTSTVPDLSGNGHDLTGSFTSLNVTINGRQAGEFDGTDDFVDGPWTALSQPFQIFAVYQLRTTSAADSVLYSGYTNSASTYLDNTVEWRMNAGSDIESTQVEDTSPHIMNSFYNTSSSTLRRDGAQIASGDVSTNSLDGLTVASNSGTNGFFMPVNMGEILVYPQDKTGIQADVEQYLADKWGIAI